MIATVKYALAAVAKDRHAAARRFFHAGLSMLNPFLRTFVALGCGLLSLLSAAPVTVKDFSFEGNSLTAGGFTNTIGPEWVSSVGGSRPDLTFEEYTSGFVANGTDHLGMSSGNTYYVYQDLGITYQANTRYTLTVAAGNRNATYTLAGTRSNYFLCDTTNTKYVSGSFAPYTGAAVGTFVDAPPIVLDTVVTTTAVGKAVRIRLEARGGGRCHFDNIRLDATPNAPSNLATLLNSAATGIGQTTATLNGTVTSVGSGAPSITLFYGTTNGGTTATSWQNSLALSGTFSGAYAGNIVGLSPNTPYYFTARATNASGASWATPSLTFDTAPALATLTQSAATNILTTTASVPVTVTATGGAAPTVTVYYGTTDGGTNSGAWTGSVNLGTQTGSATANLTGLVPNTGYFYRARAVNTAGTSWTAASGLFTTLAITPPTIANGTPQSVTGLTATLTGEVLSTGNEAPAVSLYYGTTDGGTDPLAWNFQLPCGIKAGAFTQFVNGLAGATGYYFRFRAVNSAGGAWAATSGSFTTTIVVVPDPVITEIHYAPADDPITGPVQHEFIEIHNPGDIAIDLSGWTLTDAVQFAFPIGTILNPGAYLCVAQNPAAFQAKFGFLPLGPWAGKLANEGETIVLSDTAGVVKDSVDYRSGFPWPTSARGLGPSIELIHPSLDNSLGASWRSGGTSVASETVYVPEAASGWSYFRGTEEASSPVDDWRTIAFDDSGWTTGTASFGYGGGYTTTTPIAGMQNVHSTIYYRKEFVIAAGLPPDLLTLKVKADDGAVVWINGVEVARLNVPAGELAYNAVASADHPVADWETVALPNADAYLHGGSNVIAVQSVNLSVGSGDYYFDAKLTNYVNSAVATPGAQNSAFATVATIPPAIRQVVHTPNQPAANVPVLVTAHITDSDGIGAVSLAYQAVSPGAYIRKTDAAYATSWTTLAMADDGTGGDAVAGDGLFTVTIPAAVQTHRRLVRYRVTAADALGNSVGVPYADDEQPNFAYFVYNGVPAYTGAFRPTAFAGFAATAPQTFDATLLNSLQPYHLIANATDVENCQYNGSYNGVRFYGTFVYDGIVYDHIQFKVRGIGSTYNTGKNKWNIFFNKARDLQARDNWGNPYKETWNNLILNANACPWAAVNRGAAGIEEAASARIFELGGNTNFKTHFVHWRVIDSATEQSAADQYDSDLWGLYLGLEPTEANLLNERNLPDGNIYSIEGNSGDQKHRGEGQPGDSSDWNTFRGAIATTGQTEAWYRANMDLPRLYTFMGLNRLIGNVDVRPGDNYRYYHRTSDNRWEILAYDLDMQFIAAHHWGGTIDGVVVAGQPNSIVPIFRHPALALEYRNRCRELLDLMASDAAASGGQIGQLMDEYARLVDPVGANGKSWAYLDAFHWNLHTKATGNGSNTGQNNSKGNFFRAKFLDGGRGGLGGTVNTGTWVRTLNDPDYDGFSDFQSLTNWFVKFSTNTWPGGTWNRKAMNGIGTGTDSDPYRQLGYGYKYLEFESLYGGYADSTANPTQAADLSFPNTPTLTYSGSANYPANDVRFTTSAFSDPNGNGTFAAVQWRIAEIAAPGVAGYVAGTPRKYELETTWESGDLTSFNPEKQIPVASLRPGTTYRARVRHKDNSLRYSHWSAPIQFTVSTPDVSVWKNNLMITEIMYNPPVPSIVEITAGGSNFNNDYEFIELRNISATLTLDLTNIRFTKGVDFDFAGSAITSLPPKAFVLVVKNLASFRARYGTGLPVAGVWDVNDNLANNGEQIKLSYGAGTAIHDINPTGLVRYDQPPWPTTPDGSGPSLTLIDPFAAPDHNVATNWRASYINKGSPGTVDNLVGISLADLNHVYDGDCKAATATTDPAGHQVSLTYNGAATPPADGGTYTVLAAVTDPGFEGNSSGILTIAPATQTISFAPPASIPYDGVPLTLVATSSAGLPVTLTVTSGPANIVGTTLIPFGAGNVAVRASQPGNGNFTAAPDVAAIIVVTSHFQQSWWREHFFTAAELADPAVSGPLADPDGDGLVNLVEFSMNLDPKATDRERNLCVYQELKYQDGQRYPAMIIRRRIDHPDLDSTVEATTDLTNWTTPTTVEHGPPTDNGDGTETVTIRSVLPVTGNPRQALRLRVATP
jgi:hypothetical protein